jgi:hypothetical protein
MLVFTFFTVLFELVFVHCFGETTQYSVEVHDGIFVQRTTRPARSPTGQGIEPRTYLAAGALTT